jgi:hypothetical protein
MKRTTKSEQEIRVHLTVHRRNDRRTRIESIEQCPQRLQPLFGHEVNLVQQHQNFRLHR